MTDPGPSGGTAQGVDVSSGGRHQAWVSSVAANFGARAFGLASTVILARSLGPASRGIVAAATVWPSAMVGLGALVSAGTAAFFLARRGMTGLQVCLAIALASGVALVPVSLAVNSVVFRGVQGETLIYAQLYVITVPITLLSNVFSGALLGRGRIGAYWSTRLAAGALLFGAVAVLAFTGALTIGTYVVASIAGAIAMLAVGRYQAGRIPLSGSIVRSDFGEVLRYSAKVLTTTIPAQIRIRLDQLLMTLMLPMDSMGFYAVALSWSSIVSIVGGGLATVVVARTVQENAAGASPVDNALRRVRRAGVLAMLVATASALCAPIALPLLFGAQYRSAIAPAMILSFGTGLFVWKSFLHDFSRATGRPATGTVPEVIGLATAAVALLAVLPSMGVVGAAAASLLSYFVLLLAFAAQLRRQLGQDPAIWPRMHDWHDVLREALSYARHRIADAKLRLLPDSRA
jgi:O-antigen/teichoic acid export membrane protein